MKTTQRKALIIGISDYTNLQKLDFCKNDGTEIYVLSSLGYEISDKYRLVGEAKGEKVKDVIYDFLDDIRNIPDDTIILVMGYQMLTEIYTSHNLIQILIDPEEVFLLKNLQR
jgi:Leucine-rich repeat (LRR) protein